MVAVELPSALADEMDGEDGVRQGAPITHVIPLLIALAMAGSTSDAMADSSSIGVSLTSDRVQQNLGVPESTEFEVNASHTFDTEVILGASAQYSNKAFSDSATTNLEATIGYHLPFNDVLSAIGSVGIGDRLQVSGDGSDIAYYVLRAAVDLKLSEKVAWNAVAFRYRDAFEPSDDYLTPQLATGVTFKVDDHNSISSKVEYNWKDWHPDTVGFVLGYSHSF